MKIGVIGAGNIGGTLGRLWAESGYQVALSSRDPEKTATLAREIGANATGASVEDVARFGEVVVLAIPLSAIVIVAPHINPWISGKPVIDAMNPFPQRDGQVAVDIRSRKIASGIATQQRLFTALVVRAFSTIHCRDLQTRAHAQPPVAVPFSTDDPSAKTIAARLIIDAGFDPCDVGPLARSDTLDPGGAFFGKVLSRERIESKLRRLMSEEEQKQELTAVP